jgi:hypothetical protein
MTRASAFLSFFTQHFPLGLGPFPIQLLVIAAPEPAFRANLARLCHSHHKRPARRTGKILLCPVNRTVRCPDILAKSC